MHEKTIVWLVYCVRRRIQIAVIYVIVVTYRKRIESLV